MAIQAPRTPRTHSTAQRSTVLPPFQLAYPQTCNIAALIIRIGTNLETYQRRPTIARLGPSYAGLQNSASFLYKHPKPKAVLEKISQAALLLSHISRADDLGFCESRNSSDSSASLLPILTRPKERLNLPGLVYVGGVSENRGP